MNAIGVYVEAAKVLLRTEYNNNNTNNDQFADLNRLLGQLRQLLACVVCSRLLNDPFSPRSSNCQHNVCRLCIRGRKCLRPPCNSCKDCQDFKTYVENPQMRCLLLCFKSLCEHVMGAQPLFQQICRQKPTLPSVVSAQPFTVPVNIMSTQEYIMEGASYTDITSAFATDLPRLPVLTSCRNEMPPLAASAGSSSAMPAAALHILAQTETVTKASTPPISTIPVSSLTPVMIKQEKIELSPPPPPLMMSVCGGNKIRKPTSTLGTQTAPVKQFVKGASMVTSVGTLLSNGSLSQPPTITYVSQNTPGVVMPIIASSATNAAPLSIASSRLQNLNRQLVQARRTVAISGNDTVPPLAFKVSLAPTSTATIQALATTSTTATTTATVTSQQIRNPPPIKTVSNGSAMYSVLYTGIGNKITIKRKTDGDNEVNHKKNLPTNTSVASNPPTNAVFRQITVGRPINQNKRRGCRCGNATPMPGKLTCCGQRCPCYVDSKSCIGCKCRGCRNPHRPDGGKVRPVIPELACYEIQMADESSSLSPKETGLTNTTTTIPIIKNTTVQQQQQPQALTQFEEYKLRTQPTQLNICLTNGESNISTFNSTSSNTTTTVTPTATLIPFRTLHTSQQHMQRIGALSGSGTTQQVQQTQIATTSNNVTTPNNGSTNLLQLENLQRESVLIQNADGNYQVVNLFTTGNSNVHGSGSTQITSLQRIHAINSSNNSLTPVSTGQTGGLPQIIVQQSTPQRQQNFTQRIITSTPTSPPPSSTATITTPLQQLQQQLKQNNIITVHQMNTNHQNQQQQQLGQHHAHNINTSTPLISPSSVSSATTITLSPIIVASPSTLGSDMFSSSDGSTDEYVTLNSMTPTFTSGTPPSNVSNGSTTHLIAMPNVNEAQFSTIASLDGNAIISTSTTNTGGMVGRPTHMTPALVELIESTDL